MTSLDSPAPVIGPAERLNGLLRGELAAVIACRHALWSLNGRHPDTAVEIATFKAHHTQTVAALQAAVRALGGSPAVEAGTWGSFALLGDALSVRLLLQAEALGLIEYEDALASLGGSSRDVVELELLPRQRRHIAALSSILSGLPAA